MTLASLLLMPLLALGANLQWDETIVRGRELQRAGKYVEAESVLTNALRLAQKSDGGPVRLARSLSTLGSVYQDLGRFAEAEKAYLRSLTADPELIESVNGLASLYFETRQLAKAEKLTLRCLALDEKDNSPDNF